MKTLLSVMLAVVMVVSFLPTVSAEEGATLGLKVTFAAEDLDLKRVLELKDLVYALEKISADIFDNASNSGDPAVIEQAIEELTHIKDAKLEDVKTQLVEILEKRPDLGQQIEVVLNHAKNVQDDIAVYIEKLRTLLPVLAIELEGPNPWVLEGVKLGELRDNMADLNHDGTADEPMHSIKNIGNGLVRVAIAYSSYIATDGVHPGLEQGLDTFITMVRNFVIPPNGEVIVVERLAAGDTMLMKLTYGAPTALSSNVNSMGAGYELKAYKAVMPR